MVSWTHLIRFEAEEDGCVHLGQLSDTSLDIGTELADGRPIEAYRIRGDIYNATVTEQLLTVRKVGFALIDETHQRRLNTDADTGAGYR